MSLQLQKKLLFSEQSDNYILNSNIYKSLKDNYEKLCVFYKRVKEDYERLKYIYKTSRPDNELIILQKENSNLKKTIDDVQFKLLLSEEANKYLKEQNIKLQKKCEELEQTFKNRDLSMTNFALELQSGKYRDSRMYYNSMLNNTIRRSKKSDNNLQKSSYKLEQKSSYKLEQGYVQFAKLFGSKGAHNLPTIMNVKSKDNHEADVKRDTFLNYGKYTKKNAKYNKIIKDKCNNTKKSIINKKTLPRQSGKLNLLQRAVC